MKASDVTTKASKWLADESKTAWGDSVLVEHLKAALHRLCHDRPDVLLTDAGLIERSEAIDDLDAITDDLPESIDGRYLSPLAHLVCHFCYLHDADSTANLNLATTHLELYRNGIA